MNKSFILKKKIYLFFSLLISFLIFLYLFYFLINGERGLISYYKIKNQHQSYLSTYEKSEKLNKFYSEKINRLKPNSIDLDYLDEMLRKKTGFIDDNEVIIVFDQ